MRDFIRGWKRKVGLVVLSMACVFSVGWLRSKAHEDLFLCTSQVGTHHQLMSRAKDLVWKCDILRERQATPKNVRYPVLSRQSKPIATSESLRYFLDEGMRSEWCRFQFGVQHGSHSDMYLLKIPYSLLVMPLTLLSAYLLLSKPRPAKKPPVQQPT